ncbi:Protein of uncharacterised function (DUF3279) [Klebsiella oxytoca]|nr:Protein of uncharacterised function (DUF3279) [Klebsiella oxytoca]
MYAKSFIALDGNGRLTSARTTQSAPYDRYTYHLCVSSLNTIRNTTQNSHGLSTPTLT